MPRSPLLPRLPSLLLAGLAAAWIACDPGALPLIEGEDETPLAVFRDSIMDIDMAYPKGWSIRDRRSFGLHGTTRDIGFEPQRPQATRRIDLKLIIPDTKPEDRELADFRQEYLDRLADAGADVRILAQGSAVLGGEPAYRVVYAQSLDGNPYLRKADVICIHKGSDIGISLETAEADGEADLLLFDRIVSRFKFYAP